LMAEGIYLHKYLMNAFWNIDIIAQTK
jgi:hypothetical protein